MFILTELKHIVRIPPWLFKKPLEEAISDELNFKLANRVLINVGLCVCLFDITKLEDSYIFPGDGAAHTKVTFRYVVFRPFIEEVIIGKIKSCSSAGVTVSLEFFDDIIILPASLQHPSRFDEAEQVWIWEYQTDDGKHDLFMDPGEKIRFRVTSEVFAETSPVTLTSGDANSSTSSVERDAEEENKIPYQIFGSIGEPGLGLLSWWENDA